MLEDKKGIRGCVQKNDVDIATKLQSGEVMLHLFLDLPSKLENIILFFPRTKQNSYYHNAVDLVKRLKDKKLARNIGNTSHEQITKQPPGKSKTKRSSRGSVKIKHAKKKLPKNKCSKVDSSL